MLNVNPSSGKFHNYGTCFVGSVEGPNTAGVMICVLYMLKEADLAAVCDDSLKFSSRVAYYYGCFEGVYSLHLPGQAVPELF